MSKNRSNAVRKDEALPQTAAVEQVQNTEQVAAETTSAPVVQESAAPATNAPAPVVQSQGIVGTAAELIAKYGNKSNAIRSLAAEGHKCGPISKALDIRYQHARNVLNQPLKRVIKEQRDAAKAEPAAAAQTQTA